jgi:Ca2+:H+ antiporter
MGSLTRGQRLTVLLAVLGTAAAGAATYGGASDVLTFVVAGLALAALAFIVSFSTEQVGARFGPAVTGVLQSTLGNLPEFFIVLFALHDGQVVVAQTSVVGSLFANALLVLGVVIIVGARRDGTMRFRPRLPQDTATLMLSASFVIVLVALAVASHDEASKHVTALSAVAAVCLLVIYGAWLWGYLRSDEPAEEAHEPHAGAPLGVAVALLAAAGVGAAFASDWFVGALQPAIDALGISAAFAGLVIVAIAGNAVENVVGVQLALRNRPDFAISVIVNSSLQVALALTPVILFASLFFATSMTLVFPTLLAVSLLLAAFVTAAVVYDGESTWPEGVVLIGLYVVIAAAFWWG